MVEGEAPKRTWDPKKPSLVYFDLHVKGEAIRMLLSLAGQEFNDIRLGFDEWGEMKKLMPAGQVPLWIEPGEDATEGEGPLPEGKQFNQSHAILKRLGKKFGYYSDDADEAYQIDWALESTSDHWAGRTYMVQMKDDQSEEKLQEVRDAFTKLNKVVGNKLTEGGKKFIAGDRVTIGDIALFVPYAAYAVNEKTLREKQQEAAASTLEGQDKLNAWIEAMKTELAAHLEARPQAIC